MGVNYALLRNLTAREIISALVRDGFARSGIRGRCGVLPFGTGRQPIPRTRNGAQMPCDVSNGAFRLTKNFRCFSASEEVAGNLFGFVGVFLHMLDEVTPRTHLSADVEELRYDREKEMRIAE